MNSKFEMFCYFPNRYFGITGKGIANLIVSLPRCQCYKTFMFVNNVASQVMWFRCFNYLKRGQRPFYDHKSFKSLGTLGLSAKHILSSLFFNKLDHLVSNLAVRARDSCPKDCVFTF